MALIEWLRSRPPGLWLVRSGVVLLLAAAGGWALTASVAIDGDAYGLRIGDRDLPTVVLFLLVVVGIGLVGSGCIWIWHDQRRLSKRQVTVVEVRGLRDVVMDPLVDAVSRVMKGQVVPLFIDLRQGIVDGEIVDPAAALERLATLPVELAHREDGTGPRNSIVAYGGLAPVPMTFLTGMLIDDEGSLVVMDWDRHEACWRMLDAADDGQRFERMGIDSITDGTAEVTLAVSVSYRVRREVVKRKLTELPVVELCLAEVSSDRHWSKDKQVALGKQFFETAKSLGELGVGRIHLFLAAPNSVVFRFGQLYDRRNLPQIVVYQYDQRVESSYPWGIQMPASGESQGELVTL